jgi:hypothetical protein
MTAPHAGESLLRTARRLLTEAGVAATIEAPHSPTSDGCLRVTTPTDTLTYEVQLKSKVTINSAAMLSGGDLDRQIIVTGYISEPAARILHKSGVQYIDAAGNMFLRGPGLLIDIRGRRRPAATESTKPKTLRAFRTSGVRVLFSLLCEPESVAAPYRQIAHRSSVSLGTVQQVLTELEANGYIYNNGHRRLQRLNELFDRWVEAYILNLGPKLTLGRFDAADHNWWRSIEPILRTEDAQWGGETAAHRLKTRLSPEKTVIYAAAIPNGLVIAGRLRKAQNEGDVEIRRRFWNFEEDHRPITVPTPLVYADLVASTDPRQREAADQLRTNDDLLRRLSNS